MIKPAGFIAYYRVSTAKQGASGLGLEAQQEAVRHSSLGREGRLIAAFTEVESGRSDDRPELEKALKAARVHRVPLVVAKVDRLTRSAAFLSRLLEAGVDVRFCDLPQVEGPQGRFLLQSMVSVAELEAGMIAQRTKGALAASKARRDELRKTRPHDPKARKLGGMRPNHKPLTDEARAAGREALTARSVARAMDLRPTLEALQAAGVESLRGIAAELERRGIPTPRGKGGEWSAIQVQRAMKAAGLEPRTRQG